LANIINGTDTGSGGLITTGDSSDELQIQTAETTAITVDSGQRTKFPTTIGVGDATPSASGAGITFPADQTIIGASSDANTLDDYEEGTWTPSLGGTATYNGRDGRYVKIGNRVWVLGTINVSIIGTGNQTDIGGLPFTVPSHSGYEVPLYVSYFANSATNVTSLVASFASGTTTLQFYNTTTAQSTAGFNNIFQNSTRVDFAGYYDV
jgi:hypothetical protein